MPEMTREQHIATLQEKYAKGYGVPRVDKPFALNSGKTIVGPGGFETSKEVQLNLESTKHHPFLSKVNVLPRKQQVGGSYRISSQGRNTRTNDTKNGQERRLGQLKDPVLNEYKMEKTHFDFVVHDDDLDIMTEFPNWHNDYRQQFLNALSNDRQIIGFHGLRHDVTSDLSTNELLEDVNTGWLEQLRQRDSGQVHSGDSSGEVKIGKGGHYANLDHFIQDLYQGIPMHKRGAGMQAVIGDGLMGMSESIYFAEHGTTPTEKQPLLQQKIITGVYGGLRSFNVPFFPLNGVMITSFKGTGAGRSNLSIYWQKNTWRRSVKYKPELESTADFNSRREAFHIEDLQKMVLMDAQKIIFLDVKDSAGVPVVIEKLPTNKWADL